MKPEDVVKRFLDGFNQHDDSVMALFARKSTWLEPGALEPEGGWERLQDGFLATFRVFPDVRIEVSHFMAQDDWACFEGIMTGTLKGGRWPVGGKEVTLPASNRRFKQSTAWFFRVGKDGLVSYWSYYWDHLRFLAQVGLRPDQLGISAGT
jgi:hypothetical protein